jgi:hypothetical protein
MPRSLVTPLRTALAAVVVIVGAALIAQAAEAAYTVEVRNQTLRITGNAASDRLALRVSPGAADTLQVDVRDDGSADFEVARDSFERIRVTAGAGNDQVRIDESGGPSPVRPRRASTVRQARTRFAAAGAPRGSTAGSWPT